MPFIRSVTPDDGSRRWVTQTAKLTAESPPVADGGKLVSCDEFYDDGDTVIQGTSGDRPLAETTDVPGLTMAKTTGTLHWLTTPPGEIRALAGTIYDYGNGSPRRVTAIDTDSGVTTDKAAFEIILES